MFNLDGVVKYVENSNLKKDIKRKVISYVNRRVKKINKAISYAMDEIYNEARDMYNSFIEQFYLYETRSYIRHGEGFPGTKDGTNLYKANLISYDPKNMTLDLNISADKMEGGYQHDSAEDVLLKVTKGYRFKYGYFDAMEWRGSYNGKYINVDNTTIEEAFDWYTKNIPDIFEDIVKSKWR